jgi:hypothetical protein
MAVNVTDKLVRLLAAKDKKILAGQESVKGILIEVRAQILGELQRVTGDSYTAYHLRQNLASIEGHLAQFESLAGRELGSLLDATWEGGADLLPEATKGSGLVLGYGHIPTSVLQTLKDYSFHKISGLTADAFGRIRGELSLGILGQKSPQQVMSAIAGSLDSPGVFKSIEERAWVITGTEMGRTFSQATQSGMAQAAESVPELKKQWWHAGHPKQPRKNHLALHGQVQPVDKPFLLGSLSIMHPRDPKAPASEVIRCGCDHVPYMDAWGRDKLPIFNERGEVIAQRGQRTGLEESLFGKFEQGQIKPKPGKGT